MQLETYRQGGVGGLHLYSAGTLLMELFKGVAITIGLDEEQFGELPDNRLELKGNLSAHWWSWTNPSVDVHPRIRMYPLMRNESRARGTRSATFWNISLVAIPSRLSRFWSPWRSTPGSGIARCLSISTWRSNAATRRQSAAWSQPWLSKSFELMSHTPLPLVQSRWSASKSWSRAVSRRKTGQQDEDEYRRMGRITRRKPRGRATRDSS